EFQKQTSWLGLGLLPPYSAPTGSTSTAARTERGRLCIAPRIASAPARRRSRDALRSITRKRKRLRTRAIGAGTGPRTSSRSAPAPSEEDEEEEEEDARAARASMLAASRASRSSSASTRARIIRENGGYPSSRRSRSSRSKNPSTSCFTAS